MREGARGRESEREREREKRGRKRGTKGGGGTQEWITNKKQVSAANKHIIIKLVKDNRFCSHCASPFLNS